MKFRMKALAAALLLGAAGGANAAIATGLDGNGELVFGLMDRTGGVSYLRDLGIRMDDFVNNPVTGVTRSNTLMAWTPDARLSHFLTNAGANPLTFFVMAVDNLGARRFYTTGVPANTANVGSVAARTLTGNGMGMLDASNFVPAGPVTTIPSGDHQSVTNGSNTSTGASMLANVIGYIGPGNNHGGQAPFVAAAPIGTVQNFFNVVGNSTGVTAFTPIRFDSDPGTTQGPAGEVRATWQFLTAPTEFLFVNENGALVRETFAANTLVYHMPNIPVPAALPLLLSGLGLMGFFLRPGRSRQQAA